MGVKTEELQFNDQTFKDIVVAFIDVVERMQTLDEKNILEYSTPQEYYDAQTWLEENT